MEKIELINALILIGALLLLAGILSSLIASRFGAPLLLIFLVIGMLAGEHGPGGIVFRDIQLTYLIGALALAIILFDGGMRTKIAAFRVALRPALLLATLGVVATGAVTAGFAHLAFALTPLEALLLGAIVASTDAAAVFFLLHSGGLQLKERVGATLEIESATNDPVAIFLALLLVEAIRAGGHLAGAEILLALVRQAALGAVLGVAGGFAISTLVNRLDLPSGLQPLFVTTSAVALFALTATAGGSGFLAVYLAGIVLGNRKLHAFPAIASFQDAATWFSQIVMFLVLGLLVTPARLVAYLVPSLIVAAGLIFVARPLAVVFCLTFFRFSWRETAFVAWVGLRGAVGIFLASIPLLTGLPRAELYFNVAFTVVLLSLLVQGWSVSAVARWLDVALPRLRHPVHRVELDLPGQLEYEMVGYRLPEDSPILHDAARPAWAPLVLVVREDRIFLPAEAGALRPHDYAYFLAPPWRVHLLDRLFAPPDEIAAEDRGFFGDFVFAGHVPLGKLADLYGLPVPAAERDRTMADHFAIAISDHPVIGDRVMLGEAALIVRAVEGDRVTLAGLQLEPPAHKHRLRRWWQAVKGRAS